MLGLYLTSILIFMIINLSIVAIFRDAYIQNGWTNEQRNPWYKRLYAAFIISAIPIFRVFVTGFMLCMAGMTKEKFEEWKDGLNDESNK